MFNQPMNNVTVLTTGNWVEWRSQCEKIVGSLDCKKTLTSRYENVQGDELTESERNQEELRANEKQTVNEAGDADAEKVAKGRAIKLKADQAET